MEIAPGRGIGQVSLGMTRAEVHAVMGPALRGSGEQTEYYCDNTFQVSFDEQDTVELVEVARVPQLSVTLRGIQILQVSADEAVRIASALASCDDRDSEYPVTWVFPSLGLVLWRECLPEQDPDGRLGRQFQSAAIGAASFLARRHRKT